jgi:hypothetical protein
MPVDRHEEPALAVVGLDLAQGGQGQVHPGADRLGLVILALEQLRAVQVAHAGDPWRVRLFVVDVAGVAAHPATGQALDQVLDRDLDGDRPIDLAAALGEGLVEDDRLGTIAREAVEDHAGRRIGLVEPLEEHLDRDVVRHELAALHVAPGRQADRRAVTDRGPEEISGGHVRHAEVRRQDRRLGPLAGARSTQQDDDLHARIVAAASAPDGLAAQGSRLNG